MFDLDDMIAEARRLEGDYSDSYEVVTHMSVLADALEAATEGDYHEGLEEGIKIGRAERDAATERVTENSVRHVKRLTTDLQNKRESLNDQRREFRNLLTKARAERDAATEELLKRVEEAEAQSAEDRVEWQQMKERASQRFNAYQQKKRELRQMEIRAEKAEAERDAALAAVDRVRAILSVKWRDGGVPSHWHSQLTAALDGAPEPEVKP